MPTCTRLLSVRLLPALLIGLTAALSCSPAAAEEGRTGEQIYRQLCASCHGANGEGTPKEYPRPLLGNRSVIQLARYIEKSMPDDAPGTCVGPDAQKVASYIFDAFYSPAAQARSAPPRIELSRLTVRQYRNVVADLVGSFRAPGRWDQEHGLQGDYFNSKRPRFNKAELSRRDAEVRFDFGKESPKAGSIEAKEFSGRWQGSVLAPETGEYEFILRTDNGARLWVNDTTRPLIDAWVRSGSDTEHRGSIRLLGGRAYPLRLEFFKSDKDKKASMTLAWKVPQQAETVIPARNLSPHRNPEVLVVATPFPPDDRSVGYERGTSVSRAWLQATGDASLEVAAYVASHLRELAGLQDGADRQAKAREFCERFAERAFRRPLTPEQKKLYVQRHFEGTKDVESAVKRVVLLVLNSPRFLYQDTGNSPDGYDVASRLSLGLWDSLPDRDLLEAAAAGKLASRAEAARQAERMLPDLKARSKLREFFLQWLKVEQSPDLSKNREQFPDFDQALASDLRTSLELFLEEVLWGEAADFRQLFLAEHLYLNGRLGKFYGVDLPADAPFQKVSLEPGQRAGLLSHPYLMAAFAYTDASSPIHRGVFMARSVLGLGLRPPPEAAAPLAPDLHPDLTTRERVILQTKPSSCQSCHGVVNPLGFTLEHFDAVGRFRLKEKGKPIDATGAYQTRTGDTVRFNGARELAQFVAGSDEVHDAFVEQLFQHLVRQPVRAYGARQHADLKHLFAEQGYNLRKLVVEVMAASALQPRETQARSTASAKQP